MGNDRPSHNGSRWGAFLFAIDGTSVDGIKDSATLTFTIAITANAVPSFGGTTISDQTYTQHREIAELSLPTATGGDSPLRYELVGDLPTGLSYDSTNRKITGTLTASQVATTYTWRAPSVLSV